MLRNECLLYTWLLIVVHVLTTSEPTEETDVYQDLCWENLSEDLVCSRPLLGRQTTYTECCCLYGVAWGMQCALCPMEGSGEATALITTSALKSCHILHWLLQSNFSISHTYFTAILIGSQFTFQHVFFSMVCRKLE